MDSQFRSRVQIPVLPLISSLTWYKLTKSLTSPFPPLNRADGVGGGREVQEGGTYKYLWLIHDDIWQNPTQYCKVIILQLKINKFLKQ